MFIGVFLHCKIVRALEDVKTDIFPSITTEESDYNQTGKKKKFNLN